MRSLTVLVLLLCGCLLGCGPSTGGRTPVSGTITLRGQPLDTGSILFESTPPRLMTGAEIVDGKYSIAAQDGLRPGTYVVRITAPERSAAPDEPGGEAPPPVADRVPPQYNVNSELTFEATSGQNVFDYDIP